MIVCYILPNAFSATCDKNIWLSSVLFTKEFLLSLPSGQKCWQWIPSGFVYIKNLFISPPLLKDNFADYRILGWWQGFFQHFK